MSTVTTRRRHPAHWLLSCVLAVGCVVALSGCVAYPGGYYHGGGYYGGGYYGHPYGYYR